VRKDNDKKYMEQQMKEEIEKLREENKQLVIQSQNLNKNNVTNINSNNSNNSNNININTTINIVAHGKEDIDSILTNEDFKRIINRGMNSVPELIRRIHFDEKVPENHNVYISNLRDSYVLMYDGNTWRLKNRDEALQRLYDDKSGILEIKFEELIQTLSRTVIEKFQRCLDYLSNEEATKHIQEIKEEIKKILYENKDMIIRTRKQASGTS
jgi:ABC-type antimicrobial peptide transport system permease subunit